MPTTKKTKTGSKKVGSKKNLLAAARALSDSRRGKAKEPAGGSDIYTPPLDVLVALGSLLVHVEEMVDELGGFERFTNAVVEGARGRNWRAVEFDLNAIRPLLSNESVAAWRRNMGALLPLKRSER